MNATPLNKMEEEAERMVVKEKKERLEREGGMEGGREKRERGSNRERDTRKQGQGITLINVLQE